MTSRTETLERRIKRIIPLNLHQIRGPPNITNMMNGTSSTVNQSCRLSLRTAKLIISLTVITFGVVLAFSVIAALVRKVSSLSCFNLLVLHLAFADLLVFLTATPFLLLSVINSNFAFSTTLCRGTAFLNRFTTVLSMLILTLMGGSRFYSITRPFNYRVHVKPSRINAACGVAWCFSLVLSVTPLLGWGTYEQIDGQCWCALDPAKHKLNYISVLILAFCVPACLNFYFVVSTIRSMRKDRKTLMKILEQKRREKTNYKTNRQAQAEGIELGSRTVNTRPTEEDVKCKEKGNRNGPISFSSLELCPANNRDNIRVNEGDNTPVTSKYFIRNLKSSLLVNKVKPSNEAEMINNESHKARKSFSHKNPVENRKSNTPMKTSAKNSSNTNAAFYIMLCLFFAYIIFCGPTYFIWSWYAFSGTLGSVPPKEMYPVFRVLAGVQSIANCLIYGLRSQDIRKEVIKLWKDIAIKIKLSICK